MSRAVTLVATAVDSMALTVEYFEEGEPTWKERFDALEFHLNQLDGLFLAAPKPQECSGQPQPSQE
jgi:hypothetical protein